MSGPVVIAYAGSAAADRAIREAGALLAGHPALVVTVWEEALAFAVAEDPGMMGMPTGAVDTRTAVEIDAVNSQRAQMTAQHGADIAAESGFERADPLAVAEMNVRTAATIVKVAAEHDARAIVTGAHRQGRLADLTLGSTSRDIVRHAPCPILIVREPAGD
jgi:nucleotide-binding universal stress UspA family protein